MTVALIDGQRQSASISVFDEGLLRGDGCFEAIRSYSGFPFAFDRHYQRLTRSAEALGLDCPPASELRAWVEEMAAEGGDCIVRVVLTRGAGTSLPGRCVVIWHPVPATGVGLRLLDVLAPWHPGGESWELAGVKTISYAPNMAASRVARKAGYEDALLISRGGFILEGPTFAVAWVREGIIETPDLDLGILDSVTRRLLLAAAAEDGLSVVTGRFTLKTLGEATEVVALSTVKQVTPVVAVGRRTFAPGAVGLRLAALYKNLIQAEKEEVRT